ncbi:Flagellin [Syntrophomonas zehnderi OL-4]|uniref:Flagellin n=1 Tax=Syntrophomonas zehnderi OL-4 TaxID=690567 RepID=A0A0E4C7U9_9FIRM|nr:flagellar hook-associated protein FlgL [Syntrophomonas zehnderi]CFX12418.1 Flagellin [Syntrophomonas zehnderi OL-4]
MMRVTNNMMVNDLRRNLNTSMLAMDKWQRQLSTTRKLNTPSDDPAGLVKSLRLRTNLVEGEQYLRNIGEAINFMETTDASLNDINKIIHRIRELTVKVINDTNDDSARSAIAKEIGELTEQIKMTANTTYGTKYIFAGTNVTEKPLQEDASTVPPTLQWKGNDEAFDIEIAVGIKFRMNITNGGSSGEDLQNFFMGDPPAADLKDDTGIFGILTKLKADIENADVTGMDGALSKLDEKMNSLLNARATLGAKVNRLELQQSRLTGTQISFTGLLSQVEDADMSEVIMQLKMQENVYRAALGAGARIIQPSLIDFLR